MARDKATITLDRAKVRDAMQLTGNTSMSDAIDVALDELIRVRRLRSDVAVYARLPAEARDVVLGDVPVVLDLDDEEVDYEELFGADA